MARSRYIQTVKEGRASYEDAPWHVRDGIVVGPPFASDPVERLEAASSSAPGVGRQARSRSR